MSEFTKLTQGYGQPLKKEFSTFENNKYVNGTKQFLESNSLVAKIAFLLLLVTLFVLVLRLGTTLISWLFAPSNNPKLVDGMKDGTQFQLVTQSPSLSGSKPVMRSNNQSDGIEFTYSVWLYIDNLTQNAGIHKHIFHKGNDGLIYNKNNCSAIGFPDCEKYVGTNFPNNAPGMYIHPTKNAFVIIMNTFNDITEEILVNDIPLNKWINVMIRVEGKNVDVYINGTIVIRHVLSGVVKQNYGDVYVNMNGGFAGNLSDLWYHEKALNTSEILAIVNKGPNMTMNKSMDIFPPYFSLRWYLNN
jgi:hypothetical protein